MVATTDTLAPVAPTVLVVDDEKNIRLTLDMVLVGAGYGVLQAPSAEDGLELLKNPARPVDLVILDLKLPGMNGLDALKQIRQDDAIKDVPVIVISGHATVHDAVLAIKLGATDFFEKPLNRDRVLVSVDKNYDDRQLASRVHQMTGLYPLPAEKSGNRVQNTGGEYIFFT